MKFKAGDKIKFNTTDSQYLNRNGQYALLVPDPLSQACFDIEEVGQMYTIKFEDGERLDVFEDELTF